MNMGQMLLVLLAVMLFSTILITTYSNLYTATDIVYKVMYQMQGLKIADKYIQKIDAELFGNSTFVEIHDFYHKDSPFNPGNPDTTMTINDADYNVWLTSNYCNSSGDISEPDSTYQKIDIVIYCNPLGPDTLWIGKRDKPISKIFIDMEG